MPAFGPLVSSPNNAKSLRHGDRGVGALDIMTDGKFRDGSHCRNSSSPRARLFFIIFSEVLIEDSYHGRWDIN
jgi:hypothetical protein